ncbi:serine O-acetyltransferase EpsC [Imtechella halotolerans]|uniref:Serine acetyltransferase n=1 Tax=Imtechella halotolerans K1 TaxID=946077 RepID=I0W728_9FLAO|nr:serine O-acetyltransferase EpsC [Imtechella halotolerans]EID72194.1 serine O-acetyltransferase [Imtechella halotolerans K1]WMQ64297.1 serine O-acetyltransferase EpsC [Imtechella halotolerans]
MSQESIISLLEAHKKHPNLKIRLKEKAELFTHRLFYTLFDAETPVAENLKEVETIFTELVDLVCWKTEKPCHTVWEQYVSKLPNILEKLNLDACATTQNDPASHSIEEVYLCYPGFHAIAVYRLAHELHKMGFPMVPRLMTEYAHRLTGVDINPGAQIGDSFFIDHATGVVIGETTIIKNNVKIYQGVTLGALSVSKKMQNVKRHPTIEDNVTIYANATILGGETIIGANSVIGGNVWLTSSIPANSLVTHTPEIKIKTVNHE